MNGERWFFDTNVLVYLFDAKAADKQGLPVPVARKAMLEFAEISDVVNITVSLVEAATIRVEESGFSFWDSLIGETAIENGAQRLWSEDLQDGQAFGDLIIVNPFGSGSGFHNE
jgi:predicted nucleic acid-binding protein